jgi:serine protease inhibitor
LSSKLDEAGTKTAAVTDVVVGENGVPIVKEVTLDKPFIRPWDLGQANKHYFVCWTNS